MKFNKDHIREKHIWKDVEWGKRAKNYNPKGKDPGNVWIPTKDDGHANITEHILLSDREVIDRITAMTECGTDYELLTDNNVCIQQKNTSVYSRAEQAELPDCTGRVVFGTSEEMSKIKDGTVSVAVTSPPYWNLKDYFKAGQIGQESYEDYIFRMGKVWKQCYDKLKKDGVLWVNINIRSQNGKVILIPYDIVKQCQKIGFIYKGILIWHKSSGIPTGEKNIVDRHEYVLIFAKDKKSSLNMEVYHNIKDYKNDDINGGAFWNINRKAGSVGKKYIHPAIYPTELVSRIVRINSQPGDLITDPFLGSGTSLIASLQSHRNFIGYEYNEGFKELMESRFSAELDDAVGVGFEYQT
jgi:DNA modification methylase